MCHLKYKTQRQGSQIRRQDPGTSTRIHKTWYLPTFKLDKEVHFKFSFLSAYFPMGALPLQNLMKPLHGAGTCTILCFSVNLS